MLVVYSNLKKICKHTAIKLRRDFKCTDYIVDFTDIVTEEDVKNLKKNKIRPYYRIQFYTKPCGLDLEQEVNNALSLGFEYFALDLEAYSGSDVWLIEQYADSMGIETNNILKDKFKKIMIYPENLGSTKYRNYDIFISHLKDLDLVFLSEATYEIWKPWDLFFRKRELENKYKKVCFGMWSDSMWDLKGQPNWLKKITKKFIPIIQIIQANWFLKQKNVFYYTERADFIDDCFQHCLMKMRKRQ